MAADSVDLRLVGTGDAPAPSPASPLASRQRRPPARSLALVKRFAALLAALLLALALPALATAQLGPTNVPAPLTEAGESDEEVAVEEDPGLSTLQLVLIFGAAIGVVAVIGVVIMRDARHAAPAAARASAKAAAAAGGGTPKTKSAREREREKARKRSKAKAARNQRKRNRPR